ncbi:OsmC family protein [Lysobacter antibioticus]|uniref:OsmC family protein n=1 Tax=Lysobacter antibioticus TaxID=84531 RepID=UPI0007E8C1D6|nr:OsmC family protein [Lysobacter antibioticus]
MTGEHPIRVRLEQDEDYAFRVEFDEAGLDALLVDEQPPLGEGRGPNPARLLLTGIAHCLAASLLFSLRKYGNGPDKLRGEISATLIRNAQGRWRIPRISAELYLPDGNEQYLHLERILQQFEEFCIVTQSVRQGINVDVTVYDAHRHRLLGDKSFEAGS